MYYFCTYFPGLEISINMLAFFFFETLTNMCSTGALGRGNSSLRGTTKGCEMERLQKIDPWTGCNFVQPHRVGHLLGHRTTMEPSWNCH